MYNPKQVTTFPAHFQLFKTRWQKMSGRLWQLKGFDLLVANGHPLAGQFHRKPDQKMTDIAQMTPQDFEPLIGQAFVVSSDFGQVALTLDNIKHGSEATLRDSPVEIEGRVLPPRRAFSLTLEGPREPLLQARIYRMQMPGIGGVELFVSPFRQDAHCTLYEIGFS